MNVKPRCKSVGDAYLGIYRSLWTARQFAFEGEWGKAVHWAGDAEFFVGLEVSRGNIAGDNGKVLNDTIRTAKDAIYSHKLRETDDIIYGELDRVADMMMDEVIKCELKGG